MRITRRTLLDGAWHDQGAIEEDARVAPSVESAARLLGAIPGDFMVFEYSDTGERRSFEVYWPEDGNLAIKAP